MGQDISVQTTALSSEFRSGMPLMHRRINAIGKHAVHSMRRRIRPHDRCASCTLHFSRVQLQVLCAGA